MLRPSRARTVLPAIAAASLASSVAVPPASAQLVDRAHDRGTFTIPDDEVCGIAVTTTVTFVDNFHLRIGPDGFLLFQGTGRVTVTWTNPDTDLSVTNRISGTNFKDLSATDNGDGTMTLRTAVTGVPENVVLPDGTVAIKDVGRIVFVSVINYGGTPTDLSDDVTIESGIESISGPHPDAESDFELFCPAVVDGLT